MSQQVKKLLLITLFFAGSGWIAGLIVALDNSNVGIVDALMKTNPYRAMLSTVLWGWGSTWVISKCSERRYWWLWLALLSPIFIVLAAQTYFLIWPNYHGRVESYKTTLIFIKSYWVWLVPLSFVTLVGLGRLLRNLKWNDVLVDAIDDIWESVVDISSSRRVLTLEQREELLKHSANRDKTNESLDAGDQTLKQDPESES
ncbi:MAG: hypothetical protein CMK59_06265 [Proteobacteria bacterium]|nr:hypothetical protein [Pseudomonadota bacterium]